MFYKLRTHLFQAIIWFVLALYALSLIVLLAWGVMTVFKTQDEFLISPLALPREWTIMNFVDVVTKLTTQIAWGAGVRTIFYEEMLLYSVIFSVSCAIVTTIVPTVMSYLVAKYPYFISRVIYAVVIIVMILPIVGSLPSEITLLRTLHLYDSLVGILIMKSTFTGMFFLVMYATFKALPWDFAESAFIDGAGHFTVFFRIMLPFAKTTMFSVFLLNFIGFWNDYLSPAMYIPSMPTLAFVMHTQRFMSGIFNRTPVQLAASILLMIPLIILYIAFQGKLMGSMIVGGIKG